MRPISSSSLARSLDAGAGREAVHPVTSIGQGRSLEKPASRGRPVPGNDSSRIGSDRSFGFVMATFFAIVAVAPIFGGKDIQPWAALLSAAFAGTAAVRPSLLHPLNRAWFHFGALLHRIVSPVVLGLLFFGAITPTAVVMRAMRRDVLGLKFDASAKSYWIRRPDGQASSSMTRQF
jgi:hypothetical protein